MHPKCRKRALRRADRLPLGRREVGVCRSASCKPGVFARGPAARRLRRRRRWRRTAAGPQSRQRPARVHHQPDRPALPRIRTGTIYHRDGHRSGRRPADLLAFRRRRPGPVPASPPAARCPSPSRPISRIRPTLDANNAYLVQISVSDGRTSTVLNLTVNVTNVGPDAFRVEPRRHRLQPSRCSSPPCPTARAGCSSSSGRARSGSSIRPPGRRGDAVPRHRRPDHDRRRARPARLRPRPQFRRRAAPSTSS